MKYALCLDLITATQLRKRTRSPGFYTQNQHTESDSDNNSADNEYEMPQPTGRYYVRKRVSLLNNDSCVDSDRMNVSLGAQAMLHNHSVVAYHDNRSKVCKSAVYKSRVKTR